MSDMMAWLLAVTALLIGHGWAAYTYAWVYGRPLRLRWSWAALGLLLFHCRAAEWEVSR